MSGVLPNRELRLVDAKPSVSIQDLFLNMVRKEKAAVTIYMVSGVKLIGNIKAFDKYALLLGNKTHTNLQEMLVYKHAISTVTHKRAGLPGESGSSPAIQREPEIGKS